MAGPAGYPRTVTCLFIFFFFLFFSNKKKNEVAKTEIKELNAEEKEEKPAAKENTVNFSPTDNLIVFFFCSLKKRTKDKHDRRKKKLV